MLAVDWIWFWKIFALFPKNEIQSWMGKCDIGEHLILNLVSLLNITFSVFIHSFQTLLPVKQSYNSPGLHNNKTTWMYKSYDKHFNEATVDQIFKTGKNDNPLARPPFTCLNLSGQFLCSIKNLKVILATIYYIFILAAPL